MPDDLDDTDDRFRDWWFQRGPALLDADRYRLPVVAAEEPGELWQDGGGSD